MHSGQPELSRLAPWGDSWPPRLTPSRAPTLSSGFAELDRQLPNAGWPVTGLTELLIPADGVDTIQLLLPLLAQLSRQRRWIAWIAPPYIPYAPALADAGVDLSRILFIHPKPGRDGLEVVAASLQAGTCSAVLAWPLLIDAQRLQRLQQAADGGGSLGIMFRPQQVGTQPSPAALRLYLQQRANALQVEVLKPQAGEPISLSWERLLTPQRPVSCVA